MTPAGQRPGSGQAAHKLAMTPPSTLAALISAGAETPNSPNGCGYQLPGPRPRALRLRVQLAALTLGPHLLTPASAFAASG